MDANFAFKTWKHAGVSFLAFPIGTSVMIMDEMGRNYGSWMTVDRFRQLQTKGDDLAKPLAGCKVYLSGRVVPSDAD